ncbi:MAG: cyclic nucleotide-binding domain-containing protein [Deltaproteobacteria bacterium]|nr:cyclic nucleotide-binding domain-containing protein [Deltaproteobacteria bacterium]
MDSVLSAFFRGVSSQDIEQAMRHFERVSAAPGEVLMQEGERDPCLVLVLDGVVEVSAGGVPVGRAGPGEVLGELGLFAGVKRSARVVALSPVHLLLLTASEYRRLRERFPPVAVAVEVRSLQAVAARVRAVGGRVASAAAGEPLSKIVSWPSFVERFARLVGGAGRGEVDIHVDRVLCASSHFQGCEDEVGLGLSELFTARRYVRGDFLCREGEEADALYVLAFGEVDVVIGTGRARAEPLATLKAGDVLGQVAMVLDTPRMASCVARGEVLVLVLSREVWQAHAGAVTPRAFLLRRAMIRSLASQLTGANAKLSLYLRR